MDEIRTAVVEEVDYDAERDQKFQILNKLLENRQMRSLQLILEDMNEFDVAEFLSEIDEKRRPMVFRMLSKEMAADVFANFDVDDQETIINSITDSELSVIMDELYMDDVVDMMEELPANVVKRVMRAAKPDHRRLINQYLNYPENSAGSIMTAEFVDLKKYMNVRESIARIRKIGEDKETIYICFVTTSDRKLEGIVTVKDLLLHDDDMIIEEIMDTNVIYANTTDDQEEVSEKISDYDLLAIPVVDRERRLVGIITVDDVIDVRIPWLMFLMISATFTSMIITGYEDSLAAQAVLISFIPMLMGTGGNSGAQASTAVIRSISLGDVEPKDAFAVLWKEWRVSLMAGASLAAVNFIKMNLVDRMLLNNPSVTLIVAATVSISIIFIVMFAKVVGSLLPILAEKIGVDPAVMANPLISTITDTVSLMIYFFIARILLHL